MVLKTPSSALFVKLCVHVFMSSACYSCSTINLLLFFYISYCNKSLERSRPRLISLHSTPLSCGSLPEKPQSEKAQTEKWKGPIAPVGRNSWQTKRTASGLCHIRYGLALPAGSEWEVLEQGAQTPPLLPLRPILASAQLPCFTMEIIVPQRYALINYP